MPNPRPDQKRRLAAEQKRLVAMHAALDPEAFTQAVFRLLLAAAPGCFAAAFLRMFNTRSSLVIDSRGGRLERAETELFHRDHPGLAYLSAHPASKLIPTRGVLPPEPALFATAFYRDIMQPLGWRHAVALLFRDSPSVEDLDCIYCVHRTAAQGDFSDAELACLARLHPQINRARLRLQRLSAERATRHTLEELLRCLPLPAVLLDWDLRPVFHNADGRQLLARWRLGRREAGLRKAGSKRACPTLPDELLAACAELKTEWLETLRRNPHAVGVPDRELTHSRGDSLRATLSLAPPPAGVFNRPSLLLRLNDHRLPAARIVPDVGSRRLALLAALSPRERDLVRLVREGWSNQEIATNLGRSLSTVKGELSSAYRKLNIPSRARLMALLR